MTGDKKVATLQLYNFNSHAHVERDDLTVNTVRTLDNFNSHAHVERDAADMKNAGIKHISTHTLTWSVTKLSGDTEEAIKISTHTLTWSVTGNSAARYSSEIISTHTLTWSVT